MKDSSHCNMGLEMLHLIIVYCLVSDRMSCINKTLPLAPPAGITLSSMHMPMVSIGCMVAGQQEAAKYVEEHPAYTISSLRCELASADQKGA
jgi:hypothetical protein